MMLTSLVADPLDFADQTGWEAKPEGLCRGEVCVPAPGAIRDDGRLDVSVIAEQLRMPLVHDEQHGLWALGPASGGRALTSAVAADPTLQGPRRWAVPAVGAPGPQGPLGGLGQLVRLP